MTTNREKQVARLLRAMNADLMDATGDYWRGGKNPKSVMIDAGKSVLKYMANDLGLTEFKVSHNAVPGEASLIGLWTENNGVYVIFSGYDMHWYRGQFMFRTIKHMRDFSGGANQWTPVEQLRYDWRGVIDKLLRLKLTS